MIRIAGTTFDFRPESDTCPLSLAAAYQPFFISRDTTLPSNKGDEFPSGRYLIVQPDTPRLPSIKGTAFWANEIWRMGHSNNGGWTIEICDVIRDRWVAVAHLADDFSTGTIQPFHGRRAAPAPHALNYPYDQAILINRLLHNDVAVIHGAGIIIDGKGYVFFGPSGIGKTTISRLWVNRGATLLNDDRIALYRHPASGWQIAGTPWHGEEPVVSPLHAPLAGVVRLRQAPDNQVRILSNVEGLSELLGCALIPFFSRDGIERAMDLLGALPDAVPMVEFSLRPEQEALDMFLAAMVV